MFEAALSVDARAIELRWTRDGEELADDGRVSGSGSRTLVIAAARVEDNGEYRLRASIAGVVVESPRRDRSGALLGVASDIDQDGVADARDLLLMLQALADR
ncbi:MAG: hypothetical protein HC927_08770 [Deltaproteobacteria bacterium]|nr:hypothetical protein [Deltaproteobacteria bacterium]